MKKALQDYSSIGPGDEVAVPAYTFLAMVTLLLRLDANPDAVKTVLQAYADLAQAD